ncbi:MAG: hypothetical protein CMO01_02835 [Thalassobius sp.]|nr:hypothetical protein [Thalassovita sp.]
MKYYELPYFGKVDLNKLEDAYDAEMELEEQEISLSIFFDSTSISEVVLGDLENFLQNIEESNNASLEYILNDFNSESSITKDFIKYFIENLEDEIADMIDFESTIKSPENQLLENLQLTNIAIYPESNSEFAVLDYAIEIEDELSDDLLVVILDKSGKLIRITWES